jgi:hypothetical protein
MTDEKKTEAIKTLYRGMTNPRKLRLLLEELEQQKITIPTKQNVTEIFKKHGWTPSEAQAWQYKRKAEEEIRKKERATTTEA